MDVHARHDKLHHCAHHIIKPRFYVSLSKSMQLTQHNVEDTKLCSLEHTIASSLNLHCIHVCIALSSPHFTYQMTLTAQLHDILPYQLQHWKISSGYINYSDI